MQYSFTCYILKKIFHNNNEENPWGSYSFSTKEKLPHTRPLNKDYMSRKKKGISSGMYIGSLCGNFLPLLKNAQYDVLAEIRTSRHGEDIYHNYNVLKITPLLNKEEDIRSFLESIIPEAKTNILLSVYPDIIKRIINDGDVDLSMLKGIKQKTFEKIRDKVIDNYWMNELLTWLSPLGITNGMIRKLADGETDLRKLRQQITENPYMLTKIRGIGFIKCDEIAKKINPDIITSKYRLDSFINWFLFHIANTEGDTIIKKERLLKEVNERVPECSHLLEINLLD